MKMQGKNPPFSKKSKIPDKRLLTAEKGPFVSTRPLLFCHKGTKSIDYFLLIIFLL
jgi:hypothetical protein